MRSRIVEKVLFFTELGCTLSLASQDVLFAQYIQCVCIIIREKHLEIPLIIFDGYDPEESRIIPLSVHNRRINLLDTYHCSQFRIQLDQIVIHEIDNEDIAIQRVDCQSSRN